MFSIRNGHYWVHRKNIDKTYRLRTYRLSTIVQYSNFDHWLIDYKKRIPLFLRNTILKCLVMHQHNIHNLLSNGSKIVIPLRNDKASKMKCQHAGNLYEVHTRIFALLENFLEIQTYFKKNFKQRPAFSKVKFLISI